MERVIPKKNELDSQRWEFWRTCLRITFWALLVAFTVVVLRLVFLVPDVGKAVKQIPLISVFYEDVFWEKFAITTICILYIVVIIVVRQYIIKFMLGKRSRDACVFLALVAAEELEGGNPVTACLSVEKLLLSLSDFLGQKLVAFGKSSVTPKKVMRVTPDTIPKRAVFRAIQANGDTTDFQERLRDLAIGLHGNAAAGYLPAHQFLVWLDKKAEPYRQISQSFLDKHPTLRTVLVEWAIGALSLLGVIVAALMNQ